MKSNLANNFTLFLLIFLQKLFVLQKLEFGIPWEKAQIFTHQHIPFYVVWLYIVFSTTLRSV